MYLWTFQVWELISGPSSLAVIFLYCPWHQKSANTQDKTQEERQEILRLLFFTFFLLVLEITASLRSTIYVLLA